MGSQKRLRNIRTGEIRKLDDGRIVADGLLGRYARLSRTLGKDHPKTRQILRELKRREVDGQLYPGLKVEADHVGPSDEEMERRRGERVCDYLGHTRAKLREEIKSRGFKEPHQARKADLARLLAEDDLANEPQPPPEVRVEPRPQRRRPPQIMRWPMWLTPDIRGAKRHLVNRDGEGLCGFDPRPHKGWLKVSRRTNRPKCGACLHAHHEAAKD